MEQNLHVIESLVEKVSEYGKTKFDLVKLKALDKTTDVVSTFIPHYVVFVLFLIFIVFASLGLAIWLGEILGKTYYGLFVVAAFYAVIVIIFQFILHDRIKKIVGNYFINHINN